MVAHANRSTPSAYVPSRHITKKAYRMFAHAWMSKIRFAPVLAPAGTYVVLCPGEGHKCNYQVTVTSTDAGYSLSCTCLAGENRQPDCAHRLLVREWLLIDDLFLWVRRYGLQDREAA